ncbi:MAG: CBS domain-containing protein [Candidatus Binatia bacterium]
MQVRDVMTRDPEVVEPDTSVQDAARKMKGLDIGPLPVCDGERLLGILTDRDITVRAAAEGRDLSHTPVRDVMTSDVQFCFEDDDVAEAARLMQEGQIRRLLVLDGRKNLVGIVALKDLALEAGDRRLSGETLEVISEAGEAAEKGASAMSLNRSRTSEGTERYEPRARNLTGRNTVAGLFRDRPSAEQAIADLKEAGFTGDQIGVVMRDPSEKGHVSERRESDRGGSHAASGAMTGVVGGGLLGGLAGYLLAIGALTIPGIGPVLAGGAIAQALGLGVIGTTAAVGAGIGAAAGGLVGALVGMGIPEEEARYFEKGLATEEVLVTVKAGDRVMEALAILESNDADTGLGRASRAH